MSEKIEFEIQHENKNWNHAWFPAGGRDGFFSVDEYTRIATRVRTVEQARQEIERLRILYYEPNCLQVPAHRIVKVTVTTTYDVVE